MGSVNTVYLAIPCETGKKVEDSNPPPWGTLLPHCPGRCLRSQPGQCLPASAGPAYAHLQPRHHFQTCGETPQEAKPRHTEGRVGRGEGTTVQWEQSCHHQPWCPSSSESQVGPLQPPPTPRRHPPAPAGGRPRAGAPECTNAGTGSPDFPPSLGQEPVIFHSRDQ